MIINQIKGKDRILQLISRRQYNDTLSFNIKSLGMIKSKLLFIMVGLFIISVISCSKVNNNNLTPEQKSVNLIVSGDDDPNRDKYINSVRGHKEEKSIVGNFTGLGIDTLFVYSEIDYSHLKEEGEDPEHISMVYEANYTNFYARSNNPKIPDIKLEGVWRDSPKLVFEGDLDGDGKDEWGYLYTGINSQWRQYNVFNYDSRNKKWRYLYHPSYPYELLCTQYSLRASGKEVVKKGINSGEIKINYADYHGFLHDTIVRATYVPIQ